MTAPALEPVDPFDLPGWLGTAEVTWSSVHGHIGQASLTGSLTSPEQEPVGCDLLAVDHAFPSPVADEALRRAAHRAWHYGEVCLVLRADRLTLALPGSRCSPDLVIAAVERFARAVGARPTSYGVWLRIAG